MSFIGRENELALLRGLEEGSTSKIGALYGRRRVGKTALVREAFRDGWLLSFEGLEDQGTAKQIEAFAAQAVQQLGERMPRRAGWLDTLIGFCRTLPRDRPVVILLDEFQWLANYRTELVSVLKLIWDQYLEPRGNVTLIVCGSIASFIVKKVIKSRALYGRVELAIHLKPFTIKESARLLSSHGQNELYLAHMVTGGIPKYLTLLRDAPSVALGLQLHAFTESGYFTSEFDRIFSSHFGSDSIFRALIEQLAHRDFGLSRPQLARALELSPSGELSRKLDDLASAGFITVVAPFDSRRASRIKRYLLTDAFLRFYFAFMDRAAGEAVSFTHHILPSPAFNAWLGKAFEYLCLAHAQQLAGLLGFSAVRYRCGPYFRHHTGGALKGTQIDLVFDRADHVLTVCEMKYRSQPIGRDVIGDVEAKIARLPQSDKRTIQKVLITRSPPTDDLVRSAYFTHVLRPEDLLR